jgi:hypothetical protein
MLERFAIRICAALAVCALAAAFTMTSIGEGYADDGIRNRGPAPGAYPMKRRQIFGLDEMPDPPRDFGPHFDYQPQPLEGGVSNAPYMH